jgi:putative endonuclease
MVSEARKQAYKKGVESEDLAAQLMRGQGYAVLAERYKTKFGEVDLVCVRGDMLVFVEVKARKTYVEGAEAVTFKARRRIENAALFFVSENDAYREHGMRFDVVIVSCDGAGDKSVDHLDNAWQAGQ